MQTNKAEKSTNAPSEPYVIQASLEKESPLKSTPKKAKTKAATTQEDKQPLTPPSVSSISILKQLFSLPETDILEFIQKKNCQQNKH